MTTGLDDGVPENDCTLDTCLVYLADPGTRWAYHNGPYTRLDGVISGATGLNLNSFLLTRIKQKTGMDGAYYQSGYNNVFVSTARSMARFGLLMLNKGYWNTTPVLSDTAYFNAMTNTSQNLNLSYGYLWWLNGKSTYMIPQAQFVFNGSIIPHGPADMFCALGKNDQKIHVVPSKNLVVIRMGEAAYANELVPLTLDDDMWVVLNKLMCTQTSVNELLADGSITIYPNPVNDVLHIEGSGPYTVAIYNTTGQQLILANGVNNTDVSKLPNGLYMAQVTDVNTGKTYRTKFVK
jgi:CubicO group peptidase (beta-lactamase class C family)